jgi:hypothetical protein
LSLRRTTSEGGREAGELLLRLALSREHARWHGGRPATTPTPTLWDPRSGTSTKSTSPSSARRRALARGGEGQRRRGGEDGDGDGATGEKFRAIRTREQKIICDSAVNL